MTWKATIEIERYCRDIIEEPRTYWDSGACWLSDGTEQELEALFNSEINLIEVTSDTYTIEVWFDDEPSDVEIKDMDSSIRKIIKIEEVGE